VVNILKAYNHGPLTYYAGDNNIYLIIKVKQSILVIYNLPWIMVE
jgi:hypothetical protein